MTTDIEALASKLMMMARGAIAGNDFFQECPHALRSQAERIQALEAKCALSKEGK